MQRLSFDAHVAAAHCVALDVAIFRDHARLAGKPKAAVAEIEMLLEVCR
jgi:hypothetical protein